MQRNLTLSCKIQERLKRRLAKFSRPVKRDPVFPKELQCKPPGIVRGRIGAVQLNRFNRVL